MKNNNDTMTDQQDTGTSSTSPPPTISYTRQRTTTKTRTAASNARRRKNIPLVHAAGGGGGDDHTSSDGKDKYSWFARKSAGWTDEAIRQHLTSGGTSNCGGEGVAVVGDMIVGGAGDNTRQKKKKQRRNVAGPRFAWEEDYEENDAIISGPTMKAAPTIFDIMDEQDKLDFMAPVQVGKEFQSITITSNADDSKSGKRQARTNAALAELAQVSGNSGGFGGSAPTSANESIGWRLLRVWGYRQRLGVAIVPLRGKEVEPDALNQLLENEDNKPANFEAKWLARRGLRVIRLPSIHCSSDDTNVDGHNSTKLNLKSDNDATQAKIEVLTIPAPKLNRNGIEYDPFRNAPEFREFHERRRALAQKRGRAVEATGRPSDTNKRGGDRYFTDSIGKDDRSSLWDRDNSDGGHRDEDDEDDSFPTNSKTQHSHYAAEDNNFSDFIGTKASSGFALEDEDDANVYQDDAGDFRRAGKCGLGDDYAMEVQSPLASEEEDNHDGDGLFGRAVELGSKVSDSKRGREKMRHRDGGKEIMKNSEGVADAWSAWGAGADSKVTASTSAGRPQRTTTMDGRPLLPGFQLSRNKDFGNVNKRWKGPLPPSGYVLKRHIFLPSTDSNKDNAIDRLDSGLGLDLQTRRPRGAPIPQLLPPSDRPRKEEGGQSLDQKQLNFHAVRASMKNRFVTSNGHGIHDNSANDGRDNIDKDKKEWVQATVTPWIPSRLLCKRWGVPFPETAASHGSEEKVELKGEDHYFRQTVFEPAVARQQQREEDKTAKQQSDQKDASSSKAISRAEISEPRDIVDTTSTIPLPARPSNEIFRAIFDADSDSDSSLFSSSDEETQNADMDPDPMQSLKASQSVQSDVINTKATDTPFVDESLRFTSNEAVTSRESKPRPNDNCEGLPGSSSSQIDYRSDNGSNEIDRKKRQQSRSSQGSNDDGNRRWRRSYSSDSSDDSDSDGSRSRGKHRKKRRRHKHDHRSRKDKKKKKHRKKDRRH